MHVSSFPRLSDLCDEDKIKVANLIKILLKYAKESQELWSALKKEKGRGQQRLDRLRQQNEEVIRETADVRGKLSKALQILKSYQARARCPTCMGLTGCCILMRCIDDGHCNVCLCPAWEP
jgi:hypothetical protein